MGILSQTIADAKPRAGTGMHGPAHIAPNPVFAGEAIGRPAFPTGPSDGLAPGTSPVDAIEAAPAVAAAPAPADHNGMGSDVPPYAAPDSGKEAASLTDATGAARSTERADVAIPTDSADIETVLTRPPIRPLSQPLHAVQDRGVPATEDTDPDVVEPAPYGADGSATLVPPSSNPGRREDLPLPAVDEPSTTASPDETGPNMDGFTTTPPPPPPGRETDKGQPPRPGRETAARPPGRPVMPPVTSETPVNSAVERRDTSHGDREVDAVDGHEVSAVKANQRRRTGSTPGPGSERAYGPAERDEAGQTAPASPAAEPGVRPRDVTTAGPPLDSKPAKMGGRQRVRHALPEPVAPDKPRPFSTAERYPAVAPTGLSGPDLSTAAAAVPVVRQPQQPVPAAPAPQLVPLDYRGSRGPAEPSLYIGQIDVVIEAAAPAPEAPAQPIARPGPTDDASRLYLKRL